jgi:hypothetical protein
MVRDQLARHAVLCQLAVAYDHFAEEEQILIAEGRFVEAQGAHVVGLTVLQAYRAEMDDPKPRGIE